MSSVKLHIDGQCVEMSAGTTILSAAKRLNIDIPVLCYSEQCGAGSACMICAVLEVKSKTMLPACSTVSQSGMEIDASSEGVREFRRTALELLLSEHHGSCEAPCFLVCPQLLDIPLFLRQLTRSHTEEEFPYDRKICEECKGKCERVCRRSQVDETIKIRELLFQSGSNQSRESNSSRTPVYNHLHGKLKKEDLEQMIKAPIQNSSHSIIQQEAARCLQCACLAKDHCQLRDLATSYHAKQYVYKAEHASECKMIPAGKIIFQPSLCIKCGRCVRLGEKLKPGCGPVLAFRSQNLIIRPPLGKDYQEVFSGFEKEFVQECPTGALELFTEFIQKEDHYE